LSLGGKEKQLKREFLQMKSIKSLRGNNRIADNFNFFIG